MSSKRIENDTSGVRNYEYRALTRIVDKPVEFIDNNVPGLEAWHVSAAGALISVAGIDLMERQHRANKYSTKKVATAVGLMLVGAVFDLIDGKLARRKRNRMENDEDKLNDEKRGGAIDAAIDGAIEAFGCLDSAYTAYKTGRKFAAFTAVFNMMTTNLPRTVKAIGNIIGINVREGYKVNDPRFFGMSLGRKIPNYLSTFVPPIKVDGIGHLPVQEVLHSATGVANLVVAKERFSTFFNSCEPSEVDEHEIEVAATRAKYLGLESVANIGLGVAAGLLLKRK